MITTACANALLSSLVSQANYVGLSTTAPNKNGSGVSEPSGNGYKRKPMAGKLGTPSNGSLTNTDEIHFNMATGAWGTCTHYVLYSSETGGTPFAYGQLETAISPTNEKVAIIPAGSITMSIT